MNKIFRFKIATKGHSDIIDITEKVAAAVSKSKIKNGIATVFVIGSTASISTMEFEPGLCKDIPAVLEKIAPMKPASRYEHTKTWGDDNAAAHVRATLIGPSCVVPFENGNLLLGQWQQLVLIDFDTRARQREVVVQIVGD